MKSTTEATKEVGYHVVQYARFYRLIHTIESGDGSLISQCVKVYQKEEEAAHECAQLNKQYYKKEQ